MMQNSQLDYHIYKHYQVIKCLGKGTYGSVYQVIQRQNGNTYVIKKIIDAFQNIIDAKRTYRQLNYLLQLQHPCIIKLHNIIPRFPLHYQTYNNQFKNNRTKHVYALFQCMQNDLQQVLKLCQIQTIQRKFIAYQIVLGINYLHSLQLIHRDIKPSNILIDADCTIKICDFGLSKLIHHHQGEQGGEEQKEDSVFTQYVAARWYRPPEVLLNISTSHYAIDLWSLGCLLAQLSLRNVLFPGTSTIDQLQCIFRVIGMPNLHEIKHLHSQSAQFLLNNFNIGPKKHSKQLNQILLEATDLELDLIMKLLKFNPKERLTAAQALQHPFFDEIRNMTSHLQNYPKITKIIDHSQIITKNFDKQNQTNIKQQNTNSTRIIQENTLEYYQMLIEQLQRQNSCISNRNNNIKKTRNFANHHQNCIQRMKDKKNKGPENEEKKRKDSNSIIKQENQNNKIYKNKYISQQNRNNNKSKLSSKGINNKRKKSIQSTNKIQQIYKKNIYRKNNCFNTTVDLNKKVYQSNVNYHIIKKNLVDFKQKKISIKKQIIHPKVNLSLNKIHLDQKKTYHLNYIQKNKLKNTKLNKCKSTKIKFH